MDESGGGGNLTNLGPFPKIRSKSKVRNLGNYPRRRGWGKVENSESFPRSQSDRLFHSPFRRPSETARD